MNELMNMIQSSSPALSAAAVCLFINRGYVLPGTAFPDVLATEKKNRTYQGASARLTKADCPDTGALHDPVGPAEKPETCLTAQAPSEHTESSREVALIRQSAQQEALICDAEADLAFQTPATYRQWYRHWRNRHVRVADLLNMTYVWRQRAR